MTENEALGYLKNSKRQKSMLEILPGSDIGNTIIKALEELKQYRTIGTPEECRAAVEKQKEMIAYCNENDCSDCYCNNGNWKETNRCMNDFIAEEIGQVAKIKWGDEE